MTVFQYPQPSPAERIQEIMDLLTEAKVLAEDDALPIALFRLSAAGEQLDQLIRQVPGIIIDQGEQ